MAVGPYVLVATKMNPEITSNDGFHDELSKLSVLNKAENITHESGFSTTDIQKRLHQSRCSLSHFIVEARFTVLRISCRS